MLNTTDIWFTAYLMHRGYKIAKYDVIGKGKARCHFEISEEDWNQLKLDFNNSDLIKFKGLIEQVKDLAY